MTTALIIGRFQPFHFGHLKLIEWTADEVDSLIIAIGSSQEAHTIENPFTAGERRDMIRESLRTRFKYSIVEIADINDDSKWVSHVKRIVPDFELVYTNGELERDLFADAGIEVKTTPFFNRDRYSGTAIRERILEGLGWRDLVPDGTIKVIERVDGVKRIQKLSE